MQEHIYPKFEEVSNPNNFVTYANATYAYYCESIGGSAKTDSVWQVSRKTLADGTVTYAGTLITFGTASFLATDLATVAGLTYNNGVAL